jgi:hypothetical protein
MNVNFYNLQSCVTEEDLWVYLSMHKVSLLSSSSPDHKDMLLFSKTFLYLFMAALNFSFHFSL